VIPRSSGTPAAGAPAPARRAARGWRRLAPTVIGVALTGAACIACGKKGPPLPPLVRLPVPPAELTAERTDADVVLHFTVPAANTDGSRPANIERVDIYAWTGAPTASDAQVLKLGTKIGSVPVKSPRDLNDTVDADEPTDEIEPPQGNGLDQGGDARLVETLIPDAQHEVVLARNARGNEAAGSLAGPPSGVPTRSYVGVGVSTKGRRGPFSKRAAVPLVAPPPPPTDLNITYDEKAITVSWAPPPVAGGAEPSPLLPSRPIGMPQPTFKYNVYEAAPPGAPDTSGPVRLSKTPVGATSFNDSRVEFGAERCYLVRTIEIVGSLSVESATPPPACRRLVDTFPPAAPKGLIGVTSEGTISLIWEPNSEKDLAGYIVLRGLAPGDKLDPVTPEPIDETTFKDNVAAGVSFVYAVRAVDKAGNQSALSNRAEETAR
jgi:hypothetical protein